MQISEQKSNSDAEIVDDIRDFDEEAYLQLHPDVARAVADELLESGLAHFIEYGRAEGRSYVRSQNDASSRPANEMHPGAEAAVVEGSPSASLAPAGIDERAFSELDPRAAALLAAGSAHPDLQHPNEPDAEQATSSLVKRGTPRVFRDEDIVETADGKHPVLIPLDFQESEYLAANPDIANAVEAGALKSGLAHYIRYGFAECRSHLLTLEGFDEDTYLYLHPGVADAISHGTVVSALGHYLAFGRNEGRELAPGRALCRRMRRILAKYAPADGERYLKRYPDVPGRSEEAAFEHFVRFGWREGRTIQSTRKLAKSVGVVASKPPTYFDVPSAVAGTAELNQCRFGVHVNSNGNYFMKSIALDLCTELRSQGADVELFDENSDMGDMSRQKLFVAPHEFFRTGHGKNWVRDDILRDSIMLNTEQIQTTWFEQSLPFLLMARANIDMYYHSARLLSEAGLQVTHWVPDPPVASLQLVESDLSHPLFKATRTGATSSASTAWADRPIDVSFFGVESPKRERVLAQLAPILSELNPFIYYRRFASGPLNATNNGEFFVRLASHVAASSKITLNLHRDEFGAFEWYRIVRLGMFGGSAVVTDYCLPVPTFEAGEHYVMCEARHLPDMLSWLLRTDEGRREAERVRRNALELLQRRHEQRASAKALAIFLDRIVRGSK